MPPPPSTPPPSYQPPVYQGAVAATGQVTNQKATIGLVLGILGCVCCAICGPIAIIISRQAMAEIDSSGGVQGGRGLAQAGFILGIVGCVFLGLGLLWFVFVFLAIGRAATTGG